MVVQKVNRQLRYLRAVGTSVRKRKEWYDWVLTHYIAKIKGDRRASVK